MATLHLRLSKNLNTQRMYIFFYFWLSVSVVVRYDNGIISYIYLLFEPRFIARMDMEMIKYKQTGKLCE